VDLSRAVGGGEVHDCACVRGGAIVSDAGSETRRLIEAGTHPDWHVVVKELALYSDDPKVRNKKLTNIPVSVLRTHLVDPAHRTAERRAGGRADKIFIVDEAELIDAGAGQNSLLKVLEEPPTGTVIVLATSKPERLLPTIRSRCQRVAFEALDEEAMESWFARREREAGRIGRAEREWVTRQYAGGSPGRAAEALEGGFFEWSRRLEPLLREAEGGRLPADLGSTMAGLVDEWAKAFVSARPQASKDAANKAGAGHLLTLLNERARASLHGAARGSEAQRRALREIDLLARAERELSRNVNPALAFDALAARLAAPLEGEALYA
jgi:DNA polymerase-3 subunit delta'